MIDFESNKTQVLLNPRQAPDRQELFNRILSAIPKLESHIWIASSGTSTEPKLVALSKSAILVAAAAVNDFLGASSSTTWLNVLPLFHVGGLSIWARAHLAGAKVFELDTWNPIGFCQAIQANGVTFTSLVRAQVFDLVSSKIKCPNSLKAVLVGGDSLGDDLYQDARSLGWPLLPSFGMTETCALFAVASLESLEAKIFPKLKILPHIVAQSDSNNYLQLSGPSLFSYYAEERDGIVSLRDPKINGIFTSSDKVEIQSNITEKYLNFLGRDEDFIKIGAEFSNLKDLESRLIKMSRTLNLKDVAILALDDPRLGKSIAAVGIKGQETAFSNLVDAFNASVAPFERIRDRFFLPEIPRTALGKLERFKIHDMIRRANDSTKAP